MPSNAQNVQQALEQLIARFPKRYAVNTTRNLKALLQALAVGDGFIETQIEQVHQNIYSVTARGKYLDAIASGYNVSRGQSAGIGDEYFQRMVPIAGAMPKQIYSTIERFLNVAYGPYLTAANFTASSAEPYNLSAGDTLLLRTDAQTDFKIVFGSSDAANLAAATAQEVATAITSKTDGRVVGSVLFDHATAKNFLNIRVNTLGSQGFLQVKGGDSQATFQFGKIRPTTAGLNQWAVTRYGTSDEMQYAYTGGTDPNLGTSGLVPDDLVVIRRDSGFSALNCGTFVVTYADATTFRIRNAVGTPQSITTTRPDALFFFRPDNQNVLLNRRKAAIIESTPKKLTVILPITSPVVQRDTATATYMKGASSVVSAATSNTVTLQNIDNFKASGAFRPNLNLTYAQSSVSAITSTTITVVNAAGFPSAGAIYSAPLRTFFYYSGKSGNTLQNVTPTPQSGMIGGSARFTNRFRYTGVSGSQLTGVFPDPSALEGFEIVQFGDPTTDPNDDGGFLYDETAEATLLAKSSTLSSRIPQGTYLSTLPVADASQFPTTGGVVLEPGTANEEGPFEYLGKLDNQTLILNPSTPFTKTHLAGVTVRATRPGGYPSGGEQARNPVYLTSGAPTTDVIKEIITSLIASNVIVEFLIILPDLKWPVPNQLFASSPTATET